MQEHGDEYGSKVPLDLIRLMFDKDIVLTIKDRITAPVYHENSEAEIIEMLKSSGITKVERLVRYPKMNNIRRFLSPLYYQYESKFSHMLYGSGTVQIKGIKWIESFMHSPLRDYKTIEESMGNVEESRVTVFLPYLEE